MPSPTMRPSSAPAEPVIPHRLQRFDFTVDGQQPSSVTAIDAATAQKFLEESFPGRTITVIPGPSSPTIDDMVKKLSAPVPDTAMPAPASTLPAATPPTVESMVKKLSPPPATVVRAPATSSFTAEALRNTPISILYNMLPSSSQAAIEHVLPTIAREGAALGIETLGGLGGGAVGAATGPFAPAAVPLATGLGLEAGYKLNQILGLRGGNVGDVGLPDLLNLGAPPIISGLGVLRGALRASSAGRSIADAERQTLADRLAYEQATVEHADEAARRVALQAEQHTRKLANLEALYAERVSTKAQNVQQQSQAYADDIAKARAGFGAEHEAYAEAIAAHARAGAQAERLIQGPQPATAPSWYLYQKVRDTAPTTLVDFAPVQQIATDVSKAARAEYLPTRLQERLQALRTQDPTGTVDLAHDELKFWGPLTSSKNGDIRGTAKQVYGALQDTLDDAAATLGPETGEVVTGLRNARAAYRKEKAVESIQHVVEQSGRIDDQGRFVFRPGHVVTQLRRLSREPLFRGSFAPGELEQLDNELMALTGIPAIGKAPALSLPDMSHALQEGLAGKPPAVPRQLRLLREAQPGDVGVLEGIPNRPVMPTPAEPVMPAYPSGGRLLTELLTGGSFGYAGRPYLGAAIAGADAMEVGLSRLLLSPTMRPWLLRQLQADGTFGPKALTAITLAGRTGAEHLIPEDTPAQ